MTRTNGGARAVLALGAVVAAGRCLAQVTAEVETPSGIGLTGATLAVAVNIDVGASGALGSYSAELTWDPLALEYLGNGGGGEPPFDSAVVNASGVGAGLLRFADAAPAGAAGAVNVMNVTFRVVGAPYQGTLVELTFDSLYAAGTFEDLRPSAQVEDAPLAITDYLFDLRVWGHPDTFLSWNERPEAVAYDVIRGELGLLSSSGSQVVLGAVTCLENDSLDATTAQGSEPPHPDSGVPASGAGYFYLVRFFDGTQNRTYGHVVAPPRERVAGAGDCP